MSEPERLTRTLDSPLGRLLLVEMDGALVRLAWADREADDPRARPADSPLLRRAAAQIAAYFARSRREFDLPLAPAGTPFQRRAWAEMARIPYGATLSYAALARALASVPRAVGQACRSNPVPILIPCHRVVGEGGDPGGYSGGQGLRTKFALLELEGALKAQPDLFGEAERRA